MAEDNMKREPNLEMIHKTLELLETKAMLEDKDIDLISLGSEIERRKKELIHKTLDLAEIKSQLEERNAELAEANKEIMKILQLKTEFINQAAHDLRTPLTPVLTLLPLLKNYIKDDGGLRNLEVIERNARYLHHIVNEMIALIKSQASRLESVYEEIDINEVIEEVLANNEAVIKSRNMRIIKNLSAQTKVQADRFEMIELLQNLLSNAIRYSSKKGRIIIAVQKRDNFINVRMADTGIGMTKKTIQKLFTEFFRADESRHAEGAGLGLSICKRIVEKHKGRIWAESKGLGKGASIIFEIPIKQMIYNGGQK